MAITPEQRIRRKQYIGSSDAPAIMGVSEYQNAADIYHAKTGDLSEASNDAMDAGNRLESVVLDWAEQQIGKTFIRNYMHINGRRAANLDGMGRDGPFIVEAKTSGICGPRNPAYDLAEEDDAGLPADVIVQVHHQFAVLGVEFRLAYVPVLIGGFGFKMYTINRCDELADEIAAEGERFMQDHVIPRIPPSDVTPSLDVIKRLKREPNKIVSVSDELVQTFIAQNLLKLQAERDAKAAQAELLAAMGDAEGATYSGGSLTYLESHRKGFTVQATTFRRLQIKENEPLSLPAPAPVEKGPKIRASLKKKYGIA